MQQIPATIRRVAAAHKLGQFQSLYLPRKHPPIDYIISVCSLIIGCFVFGFLYVEYEDIFRWWPDWQVWLVQLLGAGWILVGAWILYGAIVMQRMRIFVFAQGLILSRYRNQVIRWQEILALWKHVTLDKKTGIVHAYTIQCTNSKITHFKNEFIDTQKLGDILEQAMVQQLLPRAIKTYDADATIIFDEFAINTRGIALKTRTRLHWHEVANIVIDDTTITIYKVNQYWDWATLQVAQLPNVALLKALLDYAVRDLVHIRLPGLLATYHTGLTLDFGAISVNQQGITLQQGKVLLHWDEIASVGVGESEIIIQRKGTPPDWYVLPRALVTDIPLLKTLIEHLLSEQYQA